MSTIPRRIILGPGPSSAHPKVLNAMSNSVIGYLDPVCSVTLFINFPL